MSTYSSSVAGGLVICSGVTDGDGAHHVRLRINTPDGENVVVSLTRGDVMHLISDLTAALGEAMGARAARELRTKGGAL